MANYLYVNDLVNMALGTVRALTSIQDVDPNYQETSLYLLNEILDGISSLGEQIPFDVEAKFTLTPLKSTYTIGSIPGADFNTTPFAKIEWINLFFQSRRYSVEISDDLPYFGVSNFLNASGLPTTVNIQRFEDYSEINFLNPPDLPYQIQIRGKKEVLRVSMQDYVLLPRWYSAYLRLALAQSLNNFYNLRVFDDVLEKQLMRAERNMYAASKTDFATRSDEPFTQNRRFYSYNLGVTSS